MYNFQGLQLIHVYQFYICLCRLNSSNPSMGYLFLILGEVCAAYLRQQTLGSASSAIAVLLQSRLKHIHGNARLQLVCDLGADEERGQLQRLVLQGAEPNVSEPGPKVL